MSVTLDPNLAATTDPADAKTCDKCGTPFYRKKKFAKSAFARQRFCGHDCSLQGMNRPGKGLTDTCAAGHEWTEENTRRSGRRRNCRACDRGRATIRTATNARKRVRRDPTPQQAPATAPVAAAPARPPWRPAGFSSQPNIRRPA